MKRGKAFFTAVFLLLLALACVPAQAQVQTEIQESVGASKIAAGQLVREGKNYCYYYKGRKQKNCWKTINSNRYYFDENGNAAKYSRKIGNYIYVFNAKGQLYRPLSPTIIKTGKYSYYVDKKGRAYVGWFTIGSRLYRADAKGRICMNKTYQGVTFTNNGYAQEDINAALKKKVMSIVSQITNPGMTQSQKLWACWRYITSTGGFYYSSYYPNTSQKGWQKETAYRMLATKGGNCYGFACAFAALAWEIGYDPYVVCGRVSGSRDGASDGLTRHGWVTISGLTYDPEAQFAGWFPGVYGAWGYNISHTIQSYTRFAG